MDVNADEILKKLIDAAEMAFKDNWHAVKTYAPAEFKKMSVQLAEIAANVELYQQDKTKGYSPQTGRMLFKMQRTACESVLVAVSQLTLAAIQQALNAIINILKDTFSGVIAAVV